jgi:NADPH-dependent glutamate synthase beta subunit-like oxidoreductase
VVGAGPGGLAAAYHLAKFGHSVEVYEAGPKSGGMMRFGIPQYRLPRNIVEAEIQRIESMGVTIHLNKKVEDLEQVMKDGKFDAGFVAIGAHLNKRIDLPGRDAGRMIDALSFLRTMDGPSPLKIGKRVAVYGGGNTASH